MRRIGTGFLALALTTTLAAGAASAQAGEGKQKRARESRPAKVSLTEACEVDAAIYCDDDERRGVDKVACLRKNKDLVSPGCAAALGSGGGRRR
ncbi:hypothetical protein MYXO_00406 [Myxococcaceae bacterium]|nr:hypothetical protein MYXO_00406 [Myxococcaceae bacterium]